jgi:hypothetical protein
MVRAAGMPLNDGTLAPGMLTVRLVEGGFTKNLPNQTVELQVAGTVPQSSRTGSDGRAQFAHLPIGAKVRASASVRGERLESDVFEMPATSGVRLLLIAGSGTGATDAPAPLTPGAPMELTPPHPSTTPAPAPGPAPAPLSPAPVDDGVATIRAVLVTATISAFGFLFLSRRQRR